MSHCVFFIFGSDTSELRSEFDRFLLHLWQRVGFAPGLAPLGGLDLAGLLCHNRLPVPDSTWIMCEENKLITNLKQLEHEPECAIPCNSYRTPVGLLK